MENTTFVKIEATFVEKGTDAGALKIASMDKASLEDALKDMLGADDLHITALKRFPLEE